MVEGFLRTRFATIGADVAVTSAGARLAGAAVDPHAVAALAAQRVDIADHVPRRMDRELLGAEGRDLIVTLTREHLRTVVTLRRDTWPRTFTLRELVRRGAEAEPAADLATWLAGVGEGRTTASLLGDDDRDDVADPYGLGAAAVRATADELDVLCAQVVAMAPWPRRSPA